MINNSFFNNFISNKDFVISKRQIIIDINVSRFRKRFRDENNVSILTKNQFYVRLSSTLNISLTNHFAKNFNNSINSTNNSIDAISINVDQINQHFVENVHNSINSIKNFVDAIFSNVDQISQNDINSTITREISIEKNIYDEFINSIIVIIIE